MKVRIRKGPDNEFQKTIMFSAYEGFREMGFEISFYQNVYEQHFSDAEEVVVGFIGDVKHALQQLGRPAPPMITYPEILQNYLGRKVWRSTVNTIAAQPELWPVFIKPENDAKKFTGVLVRSTRDLVGCGDQLTDTPVWCSETVKFLAEWRCFVRHGNILDVRPYKGDWRVRFDPMVIEAAVKDFTGQPKAFGIDFGVTDKGETLLVEVNDGYALGSYGLGSIAYAKLLSARWAELAGCRDFCDF